MSYRDLRNFSEAMRALGFPHQISLESFRNPNWELVESCLRWLAARIEPDATLAGGKESVEQRVAMVTHAIELFHSRANLKLNGKKLYGADGWAVRELLKVANLLRSALEAPNQDDQFSDSNPLVYDISNRVNFSEAMRALGFPHQISLESFRNPNWELVESCLRWLAARIEPDATLAGGKESVEQRVAMVTHAIELFHSRANLRLNGKKLYGADGWAVRELLKVANLLRSALEAPNQDDQFSDSNPLVYDISNRIGEIKQARGLATDITAQGAFLYDLLEKELENKEHRDKALSRQLDMSLLESSLNRAVESLAGQVGGVREQIDNVASSEAALDAKLERRRAELQRAEKRLHTVQKIKPAYQGELTSLEREIDDLWDQYVLRYRCVEALKHQLSLLETSQAEAAEEQQAAIMQLIHKYEAEDVLGKLSDSDDMDSSDEGKESAKQPRPATRPKTRLRIKTAGTDGRHAFGSMQARESLEELDPSSSDTDMSDTQMYGDGGRWSRPRPATRTLAAADDYADLVHGDGALEGEGGSEGSLGSSSESELRITSAHPGRASALSDNEF